MIAVESNGVGQAVLSLLVERGYTNLYYEAKFKPGFTSTSKSLDEATGWLVDSLLDDLVLNDKDTVQQLQTYKNDKRVEESASSEILRGAASGKRRDRHHWDKVSALILAIVGARYAPKRTKPGQPPEMENVLFFTKMGYDQREKYLQQIEKEKAPKKRRRPTYRRPSRRR